MPKVIPLGVSYSEFWTLNPHRIEILVLAYNEAKKQELRSQNALFHLQGQYFAEALLVTVGNMFRGKGKKPYEYPDKPFDLNFEFEKGLNMKNDEDREIAKKRREFVLNLKKTFAKLDTAIQERENGNR